MHRNAPGDLRRPRTRLSVARRREQIVEVTTQLIAEKGYWGFSMQDAADGCSMSVPGLLHHVGSKEKLLAAVLEHREMQDGIAFFDQLAALGFAESQSRSMTTVTLKQACSSIVRCSTNEPDIVRLYAVLRAESLNPSHPGHEYFRDRERRALRAFSELAKRESPEPEALAGATMALLDGLQLQWLLSRQDFDLIDRWNGLAATMLAD